MTDAEDKLLTDTSQSGGGEPLRDLLGAVAARRAQRLVVGARGTAESGICCWAASLKAALNQSPVAVLVAR